MRGVAGVVCLPTICTCVGRRTHDLIRDLSSLLCEWSWQTAAGRGRVQLPLTRRVLSTSPHGSRFTKSMPVSGVPVGGSRMETSIMRYSTFMGFIWKRDITETSLEGDGGRAGHTGSSAHEPWIKTEGKPRGRQICEMGLLLVSKVQIFPSLEVTALTLLRNGLPAHPRIPLHPAGRGSLGRRLVVTVVPSGWSAPHGCA